MSTRVEPVGADVPLAEVLPWTTGSTSVDVRDPAGLLLATLTPTYSATDKVWQVTLPANYTANPGKLSLKWRTGSQFVDHTLDLRAGLVWPTLEAEQFLDDGAENVLAGYPAWKQRREFSGALLDLEDLCRTKLAPARTVETVPTGVGSVFGVDEALPTRLVATSNPTVNVAAAVVDRYAGTITLAAAVAAPITITYDHGLTAACDHNGQRAIALHAADRLKQGPGNDRGYVIQGDLGPVRAMTQGMGGALSSIPEVQKFIVTHRVP